MKSCIRVLTLLCWAIGLVGCTSSPKNVRAADYWSCETLLDEIRYHPASPTHGRYFIKRPINVIQVAPCFSTPAWYSARITPVPWGWVYRFELWYPSQGIVLVFGASDTVSDVIEITVGQPTPTPQVLNNPLELRLVHDLPIEWVVTAPSRDKLADFVEILGSFNKGGLIGISQTEENNFELQKWEGWDRIVVIDSWSTFID